MVELAVGVVDGGIDKPAPLDDVAGPQVAMDEGGTLAVVEEVGQAPSSIAATSRRDSSAGRSAR
jgi:hypothetical protein